MKTVNISYISYNNVYNNNNNYFNALVALRIHLNVPVVTVCNSYYVNEYCHE